MAKRGERAVKSTNQLPADTIILGFTGSIGSGCSYISEGIEKHYKYKRYVLSDILRKLAKERGIPHPTTENLQDIGDALRASEGNSVLVSKLFESIDTSDLKSFDGIIIDSIRNDGEVYVLRQFPYFFLFSIHAEKEVRRGRTIGKGKKFRNDPEFDMADERDRAEDPSFGQQVAICNDLSDIIVNNNDDFPASNVRQKKKFIDRIYNDYISLIKNKKDNLITPDRLPTVNETLMTIAYAESQRSSCLKRKVGCVIASISTVNGDENSVKDSVQIISSGHNEVPTGTTPCIFTEFEKCYRDHLQEKQAEKIKYCPKCGEKIKLSFTKCKCGKKTKKFLRVCPSCKKPVDISYECPKCNTDVFSEYLHSGGKLLDMCRALHAEENALLNLTKIGSLNLENSVLYTTTYPCNLCANKIGTAGIKKVIYADPYTMEDAKDILENSGVQTEKFQGIKSSAFFRLYK